MLSLRTCVRAHVYDAAGEDRRGASFHAAADGETGKHTFVACEELASLHLARELLKKR